MAESRFKGKRFRKRDLNCHRHSEIRRKPIGEHWPTITDRDFVSCLTRARLLYNSCEPIHSRKLMPETTNTAEIAAKVSKELFGTFLWETRGPKDESWPCEAPAEHGKRRRGKEGGTSAGTDSVADATAAAAEPDQGPVSEDDIQAGSVQAAQITHPTDIVFYYDEPYSNHRTYINCDLKSYAANTIKKSEVKKAIVSLARALACLEKSAVWRDRYVLGDKNALFACLLFVYNHDGEYNSAFDEILAEINISNLDIPKGSKIIVLGPREISWLDNVSDEILRMKGNELIGPRESWRYFYPPLVLAKNVQPSARAAIVEMLTGPWIILKHRPDGNTKDAILVFYRGPGKAMEEFSLLIDYLMFHGLVDEGVNITVRVSMQGKESRALFDKAIDDYIVRFDGGDQLAALLKAIHYESMTFVRRQYSTVEIGMKYA